MRDLKRNQVPFWYSCYEGKESVLKNGFETGQYKETFSEPVKAWAQISSAKGESDVEMFGAAISYDRIISTVQDLPINEFSRLWVDTDPDASKKGEDFNYKVKWVARGLDQHLWAIERVVRNGNQTN